MKRSFLICCLVASTALAAPQELTMQDLQALEKQQSWTELLEGAVRVKPSARTADWNKLVINAATRLVDSIERDSTSGLRGATGLVDVVPGAEHNYAFLKADKGYIAGKVRAVQRVVAACEGTGHYGCGSLAEMLSDGIDRFPKGTARSIALMLSEERAPSEAVHFWALAADDDAEVCSHGQLERGVIEVLRSASGSRMLADAQRAAGTCYAALEIALVRALEKAKDKDPYVTNTCPVLKTHGAMTVIKKKRCP